MSDLRERMFVAFDTETTGLSPRTCRVVEIAGVRFTGSGTEIGRFATLANPGTAISPEVTEIHGIDDIMVAQAPDPVEACQQFQEWIGEDDILIAHNAAFDVTFISTELSRSDLVPTNNDVIDSLRFMRHLKPDVPNFRLQTLVEHFQIPETRYHRAMADSLHVRALFLEFMKHNDGISREELLNVSRVDSIHHMVTSHLNVMPRLAELSEIIERAEVVAIRYDGESRAGFQRILPLNVRTDNGEDFLVAQCMHDGRVKLFRLDRVIDIAPDRAKSQSRRIV